MRSLHFDCFCGASGDMVVGALIDAGAPFEAVRDALQSLGVPGFTVSAEKVNKHGITATQFSVRLEEGHHHPHRHLKDVLSIIEQGELPAEIKAAANETFRRIAECEAKIHGVPVERVHFHEIGAIDSIVDIVVAHFAIHLLGVVQVTASPLNLGSGNVKTDHGVMPVPAPATAALLKGVPSYGSDVEAELVTPTGAALISQCTNSFGPMPEMRIASVGYGSGMRDLPDRANVLRVLVGECEEAPLPVCSVAVIECDIDDINPELLPPLIADLLDRGARDAFLTPVIGKKGRPAYVVTVLCDDERVSDLARALFEGSTTFGVRIRHENRICLEREWKSVSTKWGRVRIKVGRFRGSISCTSPEFEDCRSVAEKAGVPVLAVYEAAHAAAIKGEMQDV